MPMRCAGVAAALLLTLAVCAPASAQKADRIAIARQAYNDGDLETAVQSAQEAMGDPKTAVEARIVLGRALVERFRRTAEADDLMDARTALLEAASGQMGGALQVEWLVGSAETLFFEEQFGAAAALLGSVLSDSKAELTFPGGRDRLVDWWASAVDRAAQARQVDERRDEYARLGDRLERELERDPSLGSAAYWLVVAARGQGDIHRAWALAQSAWVRAPLAHDRGAGLRADLDRIVTQALIPERVRSAGKEPEKQISEQAVLFEAWETFKQRWAPK